MINRAFVFFILLSAYLTADGALQETPMVVVIPSYKNRDWYQKNISSVLNQEYGNYRVFYLNDASPDETGELVEYYLLERGIDYRVVDFDVPLDVDIETRVKGFVDGVGFGDVFFTLVNNRHRCGALENFYRVIQCCEDGEIVVNLDGDDWLFDKGVLAKINEAYQSSDVWLTHGNLVEYPAGHVGWCERVPDDVVAQNAFREFKCPSHLRTFYAWLFKKIKLEDLMYEGNFFPMTCDMAMMYPMVEMAGSRHAFIEDVTYVYNMENGINDNKVNAQLQRDLDYLIRHKERYLPLAYGDLRE